MKRRLAAAFAALLAASPAWAAGETLPSFGLTSGASPNTLCIFDKSSSRPCVAIGSLDSVLHNYTSTPFAISMTQNGFSWSSLLGTRVINAHMTNAFGTLTGNGIAAAFVFNLDSENINANTASGLTNMYVGEGIGGANVKGHRTNLSSVLSVGSATGNTAQIAFYTAAAAYAIASANDNGAAGVGNSKGNLFAGLDQAELRTGATFWSQLVGREIDIDAQTGTNVVYKVGLQIVQTRLDVVAGSIANYAVSIANQNAGTPAGWGYGYTIGSALGVWPMAATGTLIGAPTTGLGGPAYAAAYGVDFSNVTFSGAAFKSAGFTVDGVGAVSSKGLIVLGSQISWAGTLTTPNVNSLSTLATAAPSVGGVHAVNVFNLNGENVDASTPGGLYNVYVGTTVGGTGSKGNRTGFTSVISFSAPTANVGVDKYYTAISANAIGNANDTGNLFGILDIVTLQNGTTSWNSAVGQEIDLAAQAGSAVLYKIGLKIVQTTTDVVAGSSLDVAIELTNSSVGSHPGWSMGMTFGSPLGVWPISASGTMIGTSVTGYGGPVYAAAYGINFSAVTFSGAAFKSNAFSVDGAGIVTGSAFKAGATAGVTCSGTPTASFASTLGIVTHC